MQSDRTETLTRTVPALRVPDAFGDRQAIADYIGLSSAHHRSSSTPRSDVIGASRHVSSGIRRGRICDAQTTAAAAEALAGADHRLCGARRRATRTRALTSVE